MIDKATRNWTYNPSDEFAIEDGCRFDILRGAEVVWWIERYCRLYEGEEAGNPLRLHGCLDCQRDLPIPDEFDKKQALARAAQFVRCRKAGHNIDWQYECTMRVFGWVRWSDRWQREVRRFRKSSIFVAKKNKKSPTLAAWALYLMTGDGEPGQKVLLGAKDGTQAREIAGKHTVEMLSQSQELLAECTLNKSLMQITHEPSRSILKPMSSSTERNKDAKEGINGCVGIDETHVVDRDFIRIISRAGISRSEPLHFEFSTAGNNPDGYGKSQFDLGLRVINGSTKFNEFFFAAYAAPQDLSDEELDADPIKFAKMANPAWGHTIGEEEFMADYRQSKAGGLTELLDFKMYRLNIWQNSSNPWLKSGDWDACYCEFTEADLYRMPCWAALDLSRTRDTSALVLVFADGDDIYLLPFFWLPEATARALSDKADFLQWAEQGFITLIPGEVIEYSYIEEEFERLHDVFDIQELIFDPKFAEDTTQRMEAATGVEREAFGQGWTNFALPTAEFERLVISHQIKHNGHPVLTWQMGHAEVKTDNNANMRPVKPKKDDYRKIDGVVASIMGLSGAVLLEPEPEVGIQLL